MSTSVRWPVPHTPPPKLPPARLIVMPAAAAPPVTVTPQRTMMGVGT